MNCRQVEEVIFRKPGLAKLLADHFIEARLHTDIDGPHAARVSELQRKLVGNKGLPTFLVVDPAAPETALGRRNGMMSESSFIQFLEPFAKP